MGALVLTGDTSGSVTVNVPTVAGTNTATFPAATGTVMVAGNMPAFNAYGSALQSIATATFTKIAFNTKAFLNGVSGTVFDTNTNYDTTNYRFTPTVAGYYQINSTISTTSSATGLAIIAIYKNGTAFCYGNTVPNTNGGYITVNSLVYCNGSTDYIEIYAYQNSGVSLNFGSNSSPFQFSGCLVRGA